MTHSRIPAPPNPWGLTHIERRILQMLTEDKSQTAIGHVTFRSAKTIATNIDRAKIKMGVNTTMQAAILWDRFKRPGIAGPERLLVTVEVWPRALHAVAEVSCNAS